MEKLDIVISRCLLISTRFARFANPASKLPAGGATAGEAGAVLIGAMWSGGQVGPPTAALAAAALDVAAFSAVPSVTPALPEEDGEGVAEVE